jgi:hypothetical protein
MVIPSTIGSTRRVCDLTKLFGEYPPLERNKHIVIAAIDGLIATPKTIAEEVRSGTWTTVRYARTLNRDIHIVLPDGKVRREPPMVLGL